MNDSFLYCGRAFMSKGHAQREKSQPVCAGQDWQILADRSDSSLSERDSEDHLTQRLSLPFAMSSEIELKC